MLQTYSRICGGKQIRRKREPKWQSEKGIGGNIKDSLTFIFFIKPVPKEKRDGIALATEPLGAKRDDSVKMPDGVVRKKAAICINTYGVISYNGKGRCRINTAPLAFALS